MDKPQRFSSLDYIRGLSVLGILIVNALDFAQPMDVYVNPAASPVPLTAADSLAFFFVETFAHHKFVTLFSLLFGASVFLVGESDRQILTRRLVWLAIFGLIHGAMIWHGDILLLYAVTGLIFMWWRDWPARKLLITGALLYGLTTAAVMGLELMVDLLPGKAGAPAVASSIQALVDLVRSGFVGSLQGNFQQWTGIIIAELLIFVPITLGLMMIGLGLFKAGFLKGESPVWIYAVAVMLGAVCLLGTAWMKLRYLVAGYSSEGFSVAYHLFTSFTPLFIALGYASLLMLITRAGIARILLYPLKCAGQMAFTNYLTQSLIMTGLFFGGRVPAAIGDAWGLPWYGQMNLAALVPIVAAIWVAQLVFSTIWMSLFRYGPFEWVWRSLSHQRLVSILKAR